MEQSDLTMNRNMDNMPPLEQGETPWTSAEVQVREALLASEADAPADLEVKVMEALDATPSAVTSGGALKWVAAALVGSALVWATFGSEPEAAQTDSLQEEVPASILEEAPTVVLEGAEPQVEVKGAVIEASAAQAVEVEQDVTLKTEQAQEAPTRMEHMEAMSGHSASPLGSASEGQRNLQQDSAKPKLERRPAILEVKQ
ncbi:MAG: hypothetical protein O2990_03905 [Bacteroidetes bacterium]|nr:hypothetical protein [Bacteroidota bacterium]